MRKKLINQTDCLTVDPIGFAALALLLLGWAGPGLTASAEPIPETQVEIVVNTPAQFSDCYRDGNADVTTIPGQVRLVPTDSLIGWMGYRIESDLFTTQYEGRIQFVLDKPVTGRVEILVFHHAQSVTLNGQALSFNPIPNVGWSMAEVDGASLLKGKNVLRFAAGSRLIYDRDLTSPINSQVSRDGGKTWRPAPGEYLVQVRTSSYAPTGTVTSPVIDLANPKNEDLICPLVKIKAVQITTEQDTPPGTDVALQIRSGDTLQPDKNWSHWLPLNKVKPARFLQWRALLRSTEPSATPALKSVRITATLLPQAQAEQQGLALAEFKNEVIVRSSYPFEFQKPSAKLARLRADWKLDDIVAPGKTELDRFILLRNWVRRQWPANEGRCQRPWDALNILAAPAGDHGMCVHYAVVFAQCAQALGYNARQIILANHYVADIWSADYQKWILMDVEAAQPEAMAKWGTALYWDSKTDQPMSSLDIHRVVFREHDPKRIIQKLTWSSPDTPPETVVRRYDESAYRNFFRIGSLVRNNYLDQNEPWENAHGVDYYHCDEYLWWRDEAAPLVREFSRHTDREGDVMGTINQVSLTLTATVSPDHLTIQADTATPNFKEFTYRFNSGDWRTEKGLGKDPHSRQASFDWPLTSGTNTLEIKVRNRFEREGKPSIVRVVR